MTSLLYHLLLFLLLTSAVAQNDTTTQCPLDITILRNLVSSSPRLTIDRSQACHHLRQGIRLLHSDYLRRTGNFLPPLASADPCWLTFQRLVDDYLPNFDVRSSCGFATTWISQGCINITTSRDFQTLVSNSSLADLDSACNQPLDNRSPCAACTTALSRLQALYLSRRSSIGNISDCSVYPWIYTAAFINPDAVRCLFSLDFTSNKSNSNSRKKIIIVILAASATSLVVISILLALICRIRILKKKWKPKLGSSRRGTISSRSTSLVKFKFDEIRKATNNFSRDNIVGLGGFGNVYRGQLSDGSEVAVKRFKNCSASGDESFAHEVEVISSVRHVNLVSLKGYSITTTPTEGHQRLIVCELVKNGSLHDHLFGGTFNYSHHSSPSPKLTWPIRQRIALGMARGLAYLHYGAQPGIIHRDIKASNILLGERFEPKVADFGLAKFTPEEGRSHVITRVAGTMGYVAPEYALYGQLTERSDVYGYGVVLLELLSGKKAVMSGGDGDANGEGDAGSKARLLTDWARWMAREGRAVEVAEEGIREQCGGDLDVLERYVVVGILCSHPQLYARPTMDQVVKMLEAEEVLVPTVAELSKDVVGRGIMDDDVGERWMENNGSRELVFTRYDNREYVRL